MNSSLEVMGMIAWHDFISGRSQGDGTHAARYVMHFS